MHVLIVAGQPVVADFLRQGLLEAGIAADVAQGSEAGLAHSLTTAYDVLVIEDRQPAMDSRALLRALRRQGWRAPAILLVDRQTAAVERVGAESAGEDLGCETLLKPFSFPELVGRLHTLAIRPPSGSRSIFPAQDQEQTRSERDFQRLLGLAPFATMVIDEQGWVTGANWQAEQLFGCTREEIIGRPVDLLLPAAVLGLHLQPAASVRVPPGVAPMGSRSESMGVRQDGTRFTAEIDLTWLVSGDGLLLLATIRDITSRKEGEEELRTSRQQLRDLSARLLLLRDEEGARISRTIHDDLGQALTGLKMDLAWLKRHLRPDQQDLLDKTQTMGELIDSTVQTVRRIATELRPGILDELGLVPAIEWELQEFQRRSGVRCRLQSTLTETQLDTADATTLFRIFQEALTNIARHAQADEVHVSVEETTAALVLRVRDNGRGIRTAEIDSTKSIGLLGMRERARLRGGDVRFQGIPGAGTTVTAWLPRGPR